MKKVILTITLTIIVWFGYAQIKTGGSIETGWINGNTTLHNISREGGIIYKLPDYSFYADVRIDFKYKFINFSTIMENTFFYEYGFSMSPLSINYVFDFSLKHKRMEIGYSHSCLHPVVSQRSDLNMVFVRGGFDKIYFRFKW